MKPEARGPIHWLLPTLGGVLAVTAYAAALIVRAGNLFAGDGDVGRHIRVGTDILTSRSIPRVDLYSHTMGGEPFVPYEWLSEVIFAAAHGLAGLAGVALLSSALFTGAVVVVYATMTRWGVPTFLAFMFGFGSFVLQSVHLLPRPHLFTTLLVAVFALILSDVRRGAAGQRLLWLAPLMVLWANLHGGFLLGFIVLFLFGADAALRSWRKPASGARQQLRWMLGAGLLCLIGSLVTPAGLALWPHTTGYLRLDYLVDITAEYRSPDFHDTLLKAFLAAMLYGTCVLAVLRSHVDRFGLSIFVLFTAFALHSGRNIPIFGVLAVPWMALWTWKALEQVPDEASHGRRFLRWAVGMDTATRSVVGWPVAIAACVGLTLWAFRPEHRTEYRWDAERYPVEAVRNLGRISAPGPVFNQFEWGGYLLYAAWPHVPVFIDGQTDFYGEELTKEYNRIREIKPGWRELLARHRIEWALIPPDAPLAEALALAPDWQLVYEDSTAVSFVRSAEP